MWYKDDKILWNNNKMRIDVIEDDKKTTLTLTNVSYDDAGIYTCKATSDIGLAVTKAKLQISGK